MIAHIREIDGKEQILKDMLWTLWIVYATDGKHAEMTHVYAENEERGRLQARNWIEAHPHLTELTFRAFPGGFKFVRRELPGTIKVQVHDESG